MEIILQQMNEGKKSFLVTNNHIIQNTQKKKENDNLFLVQIRLYLSQRDYVVFIDVDIYVFILLLRPYCTFLWL